MLLMHFNGDVTDAASSRIANSHGDISFIENDQLPGGDYGKQVRIQNKFPDQNSYLSLPDSSAYDLEGAWTMQLWFNIFTTADDHRKDPRLIIKPGFPHYHSNYYVYLFTSDGRFATGHFENTGNQSWVQVTAPEETVIPGRWYYLVYMRDTQNNMLVQILHRVNDDGQPELVNFQTADFDPDGQGPAATNDRSLFIGRGGADNDQRFDGFMDELRISNTVRKSDIPGLVTNVKPRSDQPPGQSIEFRAELPEIPNSINIDSVILFYRVNEGEFSKNAMTAASADSYTTTIPGQSDGSRVEYYIRAWTDYGMGTRVPFKELNEPAYFQFDVGNVTRLNPVADQIPKTIQLEQNYPNPFNPATTITYYLPKPMRASLSIYTITGRHITTLTDRTHSAGRHEVKFTADDFGSGLYLYRLKTKTKIEHGNMTLVK